MDKTTRLVAATLAVLVASVIPLTAVASEATESTRDAPADRQVVAEVATTEPQVEHQLPDELDTQRDSITDRGEDSDRVTDRPSDRVTDRPTDRITDRPTDRITDRPIDRVVDRPVDRCRLVDHRPRCIADRPEVDRCHPRLIDNLRRCVDHEPPHDIDIRHLIWRLIKAHEWEKLWRLLHWLGWL